MQLPNKRKWKAKNYKIRYNGQNSRGEYSSICINALGFDFWIPRTTCGATLKDNKNDVRYSE